MIHKAVEAAFVYGLSVYPVSNTSLETIPSYNDSDPSTLTAIAARMSKMCGYQLPIIEIYNDERGMHILGDGFYVRLFPQA